MSDWKGELLSRFEEAKDAVRKGGEDRYVCDGLELAKEIVKAGNDVAIGKLVEDFFNAGWG